MNKNEKNNKIVIEAGHLYLDMYPGKEQFKGVEIAKKEIEKYQEQEVQKILFLDDLNIKTPIENICEIYLEELNQLSYYPRCYCL